jgi:nucleoid-associated protein YgaU
MGGNTKANRELLISANPLLQNEGNVVVIGRTYAVPKALSDGRAASAPPAAQGPPPAAADIIARPAEQARWYTVKGDDNLWRIAESQLGTGTAWTQIRDLNTDVLKGGEIVHPNMRLRLPSKTAVAGAAD